MGETTTMTLASFLSDVGSVFEEAISWVGDVATTIGNQPILLAFVCIPLVGLGVGLFRRLLNVN